MHNNRWFWTLRSVGLLLLFAVGIGLIRAADTEDDPAASVSAAPQPEVERTYLYYYESSEALLSDESPESYFAFGTLAKETVTIVAYGLDETVKPRLVITEADGTISAEAAPTSTPYVVMYRFEASEKRRYEFTVSRVNDDADVTGLVRVMLFQGDPLSGDRTLLDNVNPLLPGRSFMVAGEAPTETSPGLLMQVLALPVSRFNNDRPDLFASRGSDDYVPTLPERLKADEHFTWTNVETPDLQFYTVTVRATPETMDGMARLNFRQLNANSFFYYDYYLILGEGSLIVETVVRGNDCETQPTRVECIRASGNDTGRTAPAQRLDVPVAVEDNVFVPSTPVSNVEVIAAPPAITISQCDPVTGKPAIIIFGIVILLPDQHGTSGDDPNLGGTTCNDTIFGEAGNDVIAGGPGFDTLYGGIGNDTIYGGLDTDLIYGGGGNDKIDGEEGYDVIYTGTGNDRVTNLELDKDSVRYDDLANAIVVDLSNANSGVVPGTGGRTCANLNLDEIVGGSTPSPYISYVIKPGGEVDCIRGNIDLVATNLGDTVTVNPTGNNYVDTLAGDDIVNIGGSTIVYLGDDNDTVNFSGTITSGIVFDGVSDFGQTPVISSYSTGDEQYIFEDGVQGSIVIGDVNGTDTLDFTDLTTSVTGVTAYMEGALTTTIETSAGNFLNVSYDSAATIIENLNATTKADTIHTSSASNVVNTYAGNDTIFGSCGTDTFDAGAGADTDTLDYSDLAVAVGDQGVNANLSTSNATKFACGSAIDTLTNFENLIGSNGIDTLTGNNGVNTILGGTGDDTINGLDGADILNGENGADSINGGNDADTINGGNGIDTIHGDDGNDILDGNNGADNIFGDDGDDTILLVNDIDTTIDGGNGTDTLDASGYGEALNITLGGSIFDSSTSGTITTVENVIGTNSADIIRGDAAANDIDGGAGNDFIYASAGNDNYDGGASTSSGPFSAGDSVSYTSFTGTDYITSVVDGTHIDVQVGGVGGPNHDLDNVENLIGSTATTSRTSAFGTYYDEATILNGLYGPTTAGNTTDPGMLLTSTTGATLYHFSAVGTGRVVINNVGTDIFDLGALSGNFNPYVINEYQALSANLYLMITTPLTAFCPPTGVLTVNIPINGSTDHTQCMSDDTFNGNTGTETVDYSTKADKDTIITIAGNVTTVVANGTDTLNNVENVLLGDGIHTIFVNALPSLNSSIDLGSVANAHTLDLRGYSDASFVNPFVNLNGGVASFGGRITFQDNISIYHGANTNDTVIGNGDGNTINTYNGNDTVIGGIGNDTIDTGADNDFVNAGGGNDTVITGTGADTGRGGAGNDLFQVITDGSADSYYGDGGTDTLTYDLTSVGLIVAIDAAGAGGEDTAHEGNAAGPIDLWAGFEVVNTGNGNDVFTITQPNGYTTFNTYGGTDTFNINIVGGTLPTINAGTGNDAFNIDETGAGAPTLFGEDNDDTFTISTFDAQNNTFDGGNDTDSVVYSAPVSLILNLNVGNDIVTDGAATDTLLNMESVTLGSGTDTVNVTDASGYTYIGGGAGFDTFNITNANAVAMFDGGANNDIANFTAFTPTVVTVNGTAQSAVVGGVTQQLTNFESFYTGGSTDTFNVTSDAISNLFDGNAGADTAVLSSTTGVTITANVFGLYTSVHDTTGPNQAVIDYYIDIESITGTALDDTLIVNTTNTVSNTYDGAGGNDTATYITTQNLTVNVPAGTDITVQDTTVPWADTLRGFETIASGDGDDVWTVSSVNTSYTFDGGANVTTPPGGPGDTADYSGVAGALTFTMQADTSIDVTQGAFTHTLRNFETLISGAANDTWVINNGLGTTGTSFDGKGGIDTMSYNDATTNFSYTANLTAGSNTVEDDDPTTPDIDVLTNFEGLTTDDAADTINIHNSTIATINTMGGNDVIYVGDNLAPGSTDNVANTFNMGAGNADLLYYLYVTDALTVNYTGTGAGTVQDGALALDTFTGVEDIAANIGNDTFNVAGDGTANNFYGLGGIDTIDYTGATAVTFNLGAGTDTAVSGATDNLFGFEIITGSTGADTFNVTNGTGYTSLLGDAGADIFNITNTGGAVTINGQADADTYNFLAFDAFDTTINDTLGGNIVNYTGVGAIDLDVTLDTTETRVTNGVNTDTFTGTYASFQTGAGNDDVFVRRALIGTTVTTGAGNDTFHFMNVGGIDFIGDGATLLDPGADIDTADFSAIAGVLTVGYTGCGVSASVTTGPQTTNLTNFESYVGGAAADTFNVAFGPCDVTFNGGGGADDINYNTSTSSLNFTLDGTDTVDAGGANSHSIVSFAIVRGSAQADVFNVTNTTGYTDLYGNGGADVFYVNTNPTGTSMHGDGGDDEFHIMAGDTASNTYFGDAGSDLYMIDFATTNVYTVTVAGTTTVTTGAITDTLNAIEEITTSDGNDTFNVTWDTTNHIFDAGGNTTPAGDLLAYTSAVALDINYTGNGAGTVVVAANTDTFSNFESFTGSAQADNFDVAWDAVNNVFNGAGNANDVITYTTATPLTVTYNGVGNATASDGTNTDTLTNIEFLNGGTGDDLFVITWDTGAGANNTFGGGTGGIDTADYSASVNNFNVDVDAQTVTFGGNTDTLVNFDTIMTGSGTNAFTTDASGFTRNFTLDGGTGADSYTYGGNDPLTVSLTAASNAITNTATGNSHTLVGIEAVTLNTQAGDNSTVAINGTTDVTSLTTGAGNETVTVTDAGSVTNINTGTGNDVVSMTMDGTNTTVNAGTGTDSFTSDTTAAAGATTVTQTGTSMAVVAGGFTDTFQNFDTGNFDTGTGADIFTIDTNTAGTWNIDASTGANRYVFIGAGTAAVTVNITSGNGNLDTLDFTGMTAGINVNAGLTGSAQTVVGTFQLFLQTAIQKVEGSPQADTITGTGNADTINGNGGVDTIYGQAGDDILDGGAGNDTIYGGQGSDTITGDIGNDILFGGSLTLTGNASCAAGGNADDAGNDVLDGEAGDDQVYGGNNNTQITANGVGCNDTGNDTVNGGADNDQVYGGNRNNDNVTGNDTGNDIVNGDGGVDLAYGGNNNCGDGTGTDGNDTVNGGAGDGDQVYGGNNNSGSGSGAVCGTNVGSIGSGGQGSDGADTVTDTNGTGDQVYGGNNNTTGGTGTDGADTTDTNDGNNDVNYGGNNNGVAATAGTADAAAGETRTTNAGDTGGADNNP